MTITSRWGKTVRPASRWPPAVLGSMMSAGGASCTWPPLRPVASLGLRQPGRSYECGEGDVLQELGCFGRGPPSGGGRSAPDAPIQCPLGLSLSCRLFSGAQLPAISELPRVHEGRLPAVCPHKGRCDQHGGCVRDGVAACELSD